jgi:hypothetical protein
MYHEDGNCNVCRKLDNSRHLTMLIPESRSCALNPNRENLWTRLQRCVLKEISKEISIMDERFADLLDTADQNAWGGGWDSGWVGKRAGLQRTKERTHCQLSIRTSTFTSKPSLLSGLQHSLRCATPCLFFMCNLFLPLGVHLSVARYRPRPTRYYSASELTCYYDFPISLIISRLSSTFICSFRSVCNKMTVI